MTHLVQESPFNPYWLPTEGTDYVLPDMPQNDDYLFEIEERNYNEHAIGLPQSGKKNTIIIVSIIVVVTTIFASISICHILLPNYSGLAIGHYLTISLNVLYSLVITTILSVLLRFAHKEYKEFNKDKATIQPKINTHFAKWKRLRTDSEWLTYIKQNISIWDCPDIDIANKTISGIVNYKILKKLGNELFQQGYSEEAVKHIITELASATSVNKNVETFFENDLAEILKPDAILRIKRQVILSFQKKIRKKQWKYLKSLIKSRDLASNISVTKFLNVALIISVIVLALALFSAFVIKIPNLYLGGRIVTIFLALGGSLCLTILTIRECFYRSTYKKIYPYYLKFSSEETNNRLLLWHRKFQETVSGCISNEAKFDMLDALTKLFDSQITNYNQAFTRSIERFKKFKGFYMRLNSVMNLSGKLANKKSMFNHTFTNYSNNLNCIYEIYTQIKERSFFDVILSPEQMRQYFLLWNQLTRGYSHHQHEEKELLNLCLQMHDPNAPKKPHVIVVDKQKHPEKHQLFSRTSQVDRLA